MDLNTFMVTIFCFIDDWLQDQALRARGSAPTLYDSEVLTLEVVGEFLGLDTDEALLAYFRQHWADWFPRLQQVHRTTFVRQAANLWQVKQRLWRVLVAHIQYDAQIAMVDSFPMPVCRFARASRCRLFRGQASYGYDELAKQTYYGFRAHVRICYPGVIVAAELTPANVHDVTALADLVGDSQGWLLGDRNYWSPKARTLLARQGLALLTPFKSKRREPQPYPRWLTQLRRRIETVFSQLVGRFQAKTVWARDVWHLTSRWWRKILSHTFALWVGQQAGCASPLQFAQLITH